MSYVKMTYPDLNNGNGCRVTIWFTGCEHKCKGCHNPELHDSNYGKVFDFEAQTKLYEILELPYIKGVTFSGGDPLFNYQHIVNLSKDIKNTFKDKDIWLYTGYTMQEIKKKFPEILKYVDYIVDGKFELDKRDITLKFRGSSNQHIWKISNNLLILEE